MNKAIFCDRDGVITKLITRENTLPRRETSPWYPEEIEYYPKVKESIQEAKELGYKFFIVTNQPDFTPFATGTARLITDFLKITCQVDDIQMSTYKGCPNYKPNPGMIERLQYMYDIDLSKSWMIGDTWKDSVCAALKEIRYLHCGDKKAIGPHIWVGNLPAAIGYIRMNDDFERLEEENASN